MGQCAVAVDAGDQGAEGVAGRGPAGDDHLVALSAFGLRPGVAAARAVGGVEAFGNDPFKIHPAGRKQHRVTRRDEVIDVSQVGRRTIEHVLQSGLADGQRQCPKIFPLGEQQVKGEEDQLSRLAVGDGGLQGREVRRAGGVEGYDLAVVDPLLKPGAGGDDLGKPDGPVETLAGQKRRLAVRCAQLHPVAVELDLVGPRSALRRLLGRLGQLRLDEVRQGRDLQALGGLRFRGPCLGGIAEPGCGMAVSAARLLCQTAPASGPWAVMNGLTLRRFPSAISFIVRPEAIDWSSSVGPETLPGTAPSSWCLSASNSAWTWRACRSSSGRGPTSRAFGRLP